MNGPSALIVDERASAVDQGRGAEIIQLILILTFERGTPTLLVTTTHHTCRR